MEVNGEVEEVIQGIKEEVYKRTGISSIRLRQKNGDKSGHIRLCNRRSLIHGV